MTPSSCSAPQPSASPTIRALEESEKDEQGGFDPALMDAVITMSALYAREVYGDGYAAPQGDTGAKSRALANMDELADWLEGQDDLHGRGVTEVYQMALAALGMTSRELTQTKFGRNINISKRWDKTQVSGGARVVIERGQAPPAAPRPVSFEPV